MEITCHFSSMALYGVGGVNPVIRADESFSEWRRMFCTRTDGVDDVCGTGMAFFESLDPVGTGVGRISFCGGRPGATVPLSKIQRRERKRETKKAKCEKEGPFEV